MSIWAMPALELLQHAESHKGNQELHDFRIAFLSIDNAFETVLSTYLEVVAPELPEIATKMPPKLPRPLPARLALVESLRPDLFTDSQLLDIEYFHRMRNHLYHQGLGGGVDSSAVESYFAYATHALSALLGVHFVPQSDKLAHLTPGAREAIISEIKRKKSKKHGEKTRAGVQRAIQAGIKSVRGRPTNGIQQEEVPIMVALHLKGKSLKQIATALAQRRRRQGKTGVATEVAWQKVRRKLIQLGYIASESPRYKKKTGGTHTGASE